MQTRGTTRGIAVAAAVLLATAGCASATTSPSGGSSASIPALNPSLASSSPQPIGAPTPGGPASSSSEFDSPSGLAFGGDHLWVSNLNGNSVTEIDPASGQWVKTIGAGGGFNQPAAIASDGTDLFVANSAGGGSISELSATDGQLVRTISGAVYGFATPVAITVSGSSVLMLNAGQPSAKPSVAGSITVVDSATGGLLRTIAGPSLALDDPVAFSVSAADVFVADRGNNSVSEIDTTSGSLVRVITDTQLKSPDGITVANGKVWVADSAGNAVTEFDAGTGRLLGDYGDSNGDYGFGKPSVTVESAGNVYITSPFGTSPMVTKLSETSGAPSWYMCNTNGPYYFSLLSAMAISGGDIWVASRSGDNSQTPGARTGSLTELSAGDGALIMTLPQS